MKRLASVVLITACLGGCGAPSDVADVSGDSQSVVYGNDTRQEYYAHPDPRLRARTLESTVALVRPSRIDASNPGDQRIDHRTLGEDEDLCLGQRFYNQQVGPSCSGTLIDWDLVLTAGHCVDDLADCQGLRFVFDLFYEAPGQLATISQQDVFRCRRVVARRNVRNIDYALVQIDRPAAPPRRPAPVNMLNVPLTEGSSVAVIGFPDGIPAKIDSDGTVIWDGAPEHNAFEATLDTFSGNSGSGVYDPQGVLVGSLARGEQDYRRNGDCFVVNTLPAGGDDGDAEGVTYVSRALEGLCNDAGWGGVLCGDEPGVCSPCANDSMCPDGWSCQNAGSNGGVTWCSAPCTTDAECPANHTCGALGCQPQTSPICVGNTVWSKNACGREVEPLETCRGPQEICELGACRAADEGNSCADPITVEAISQVLQGTVGLGLSNEYEGTCGGGNGPERVFVINVDRPVRLQATSEGYDTVLYMRTNCGANLTERACSDDEEPPGDRGSRINVNLLPGPAYLFLDAFRSGGDYSLTLAFTDLNPPDAGQLPDTGVPPDTGIEADSGVHPDASLMDAGPADAGGSPPDAGTPAIADDKGCGCTNSNDDASLGWLALGLLLAMRRRTQR